MRDVTVITARARNQVSDSAPATWRVERLLCWARHYGNLVRRHKKRESSGEVGRWEVGRDDSLRLRSVSVGKLLRRGLCQR